MGFLKVTPKEFSAIACLGKTKMYSLIQKGQLSPTVNWCDSDKKVIDLKVALNEIARLNNIEEPDEMSLRIIWSKIIDLRMQLTSK